MNIADAGNQIPKLDSFLTRLKTLLRNHWGVLLLILVGFLMYWTFTRVVEPEVERKVNAVPDTVFVEQDYDDQDTLVEDSL